MFFRLNNHSGIIKLLDWSETDLNVILIIETSKNYIGLLEYIQRRGRLEERQACSIFKQVSERQNILEKSKSIFTYNFQKCIPECLFFLLYCQGEPF